MKRTDTKAALLAHVDALGGDARLNAKTRRLLAKHEKALLGQCCALDMNGRRCRRAATDVLRYHGDPTIYSYDGPEPKWLLAPVCDVHSNGRAAVTGRTRKGK